MNKIRKGDLVVVLSGRDRGKRGSVKVVFAEGKLLIEGLNMVKRLVKPNPFKGQAGGIVIEEAPLAASKVALFDPKTAAAARIGIRVVDGRKTRFYKSSGDIIS